MISDRAEKKNIKVYSVSRPHGLRGYVLLEAEEQIQQKRQYLICLC